MKSRDNDLVDNFNRTITYLRMSVTDRCDFRCVYCMAENMQFIPRQNVLTLEEMFRLAQCFVALGVQKIRLTGGEPLVRNGIVGLCQNIAALSGLKELCMSTNGSQLSRFAKPLHDAGVSRLNISLDSLNGQRFKELTRTGDLARVIAGIDAASAAGFRHTKLNCVVLKGRNDDEVVDLVQFAIDRQLDISFIEEMPLGIVSEHQRSVTYCSSDEVRARLGEVFTLIESTESTLGPSRYWRLAQAPATRVGFISPHSHNFCGSCNRVRLTAEGRLLLCLGNEHSSDLKDVLRNSSADNDQLVSVIRSAINLKPYSHQFNTDGDVQILRFMNMTGG